MLCVDWVIDKLREQPKAWRTGLVWSGGGPDFTSPKAKTKIPAGGSQSIYQLHQDSMGFLCKLPNQPASQPALRVRVCGVGTDVVLCVTLSSQQHLSFVTHMEAQPEGGACWAWATLARSPVQTRLLLRVR